MLEALQDLFTTITTEIYDPLVTTFENNEIINGVIDFINNFINAIFGNNLALTANHLAAVLSIVCIILLFILFVDMFLFAFKFIYDNINGIGELDNKKKKRR